MIMPLVIDIEVEESDSDIDIEYDEAVVIIDPSPEYEGPYNITPTDEPQTLTTDGYRLSNDITVNPIPSNYGKIDWNGSVLTVS